MLRLPFPIRPAFLFLAAVLTLGAADQPARKRVAFVMDDGPIPEQNAAILALFAREKVRVTFSLVGRNVVAHPKLAKAIAEAGHEIANHSYTHPHLNAMAEADVEQEVAKTQVAVKDATGKAPVWFWAPFLEHNEKVDAAVRRATGLEHFPFPKYHFISSQDWEASTTPAKFRELTTTGIVDGTVILIHEWPKVTLATLPEVIAELKKQGVTFVTFSELAAGE